MTLRCFLSVNSKTERVCFRLRVPALLALPLATQWAGWSQHQSIRTLPARPRLTHLRIHSWAWEGMFKRPLLRVTHVNKWACIWLYNMWLQINFVHVSKVRGEIWEMIFSLLLIPLPTQCHLWLKNSIQVKKMLWIVFHLWSFIYSRTVSLFSSEGGSETESTVDSDFGRGDLLATTSSDPFFTYKPR